MTEDKYYVDPNWCFENPGEAAAEIARLHKWCDELEAERNSLFVQLNEQLNDCINFDRGKLTDRIMTESSALLKGVSYEH